jgi:hypothetical protein
MKNKLHYSFIKMLSLFTTLGFFISGDLIGQTVFTYKEVYDITQGTTLKTFYKGYRTTVGIDLTTPLPDSYDLDSVLSKTQTINGDSINVSVRRT